MFRHVSMVGLVLLFASIPPASHARPPIRADFFTAYPNAAGTQLDALPSDTRHCGVCHFDFAGGGPRNPYGLGIEVGRNNGLTNLQAITAIENVDSDGDGFSNLVEITSAAFNNTPTFSGLTATNVGAISNIPLAEVTPYLAPSGGIDTTPPVVTVIWPVGSEVVSPNTTQLIQFTATDVSGISHVNVYLSDDGGVSYKMVAHNQPPDTDISWFVPNLPGTTNRIRVVAYDNAGNPGHASCAGDFTIEALSGGLVPTTLRDVEIPGTQPFEGAILDNPEQSCRSCHGDYDAANEPWHTWSGSMMAQAARDPLFLACLAISEQDAPGVGDLCIRCHTPGGWQEGRSVDTSGGLLTAIDRFGVQCDFCHRSVDPIYQPGVSPPEDQAVLAALSLPPSQYANGGFITDPAPLRRGPYADAQASHQFVESPFHRESGVCGTCHDVSNPVFVKQGPGDYAPNSFDTPHPDQDLRNMFPIERTYSEWTQSDYANGGVFAPQFAGNKPDGIVSTCQDCHMADANARGCNVSGAPRRADLAVHDLMGGNTFIPDVLPSLFSGEVDPIALQDAKTRATLMLQKAATLTVTPDSFGVVVRVQNETAHKLPSGYPEGRRIWLNVKAFDLNGQQIFESGAYDATTAVLSHDSQAKIYDIHPGLSPALAQALGFPPGPSFHFVLNDTIYSDNRIPPRGFNNANFEAIQSPPVHYTYADDQFWDDTPYFLPTESDSVLVSLYYQTTSKEYVEFLRDENVSNTAGQELYDAWVASGKAAPVLMAQMKVAVDVVPTDVSTTAPYSFGIEDTWPNPFRTGTNIVYFVSGRQHVRVCVYDVRGRRVRQLVDTLSDPGRHAISWNGQDDEGRAVSSGVYFIRYQAGNRTAMRRTLLLQ